MNPTQKTDLLLAFATRIDPEVKDFGNEVLILLDKLFGFSETTFMRVDENGFFDDYYGHNIDYEDFNAYRTFYAKDDPFAPANRKVADERVYGIRDLMSYEEYERSKIYRIISSCNVYYQVAASIRAENRVVGVISFFRKKQDGEFLREDLDLIEQIAEIVEKRLKHYLTLESYRQMAYERQILLELLKNYGGALILCDSHFKAYRVSDDSENVLENRIGFHSLEEYSRFVVTELLPYYEHGNDKSISLPAFPGLIFSIQSLVIRIGSDEVNSIYAVMVYSEHAIHRSQGLRMLGVTKREKQICGLLAQNLNNCEIADQLGISEHTCKRHMENIYKKFGVSRRRDLIELLMEN